MKFLFVQPTGDKYGHFGLHVSKLAQELSFRGHSVTICTNKLDAERFVENPRFKILEVGRDKLAFEEIDRNANSQPIRYWFGYFRNSWLVLRAALKFTSNENFDGIYITDVEFMLAAIALLLHKKTLPPIIMQVNASNFSFVEYPGNFCKKIYKVFQREIFRLSIGKKITAFSILGEWHRPRLISQLRLPESYPIELVPDGGGEHPNPMARETARNILGIDWSGDIFLFMGILRRDKGLEDLSVALSNLWHRRKDFRVILAGYPFEYSKAEVQQLFSYPDKSSPILCAHLDYVPEEKTPSYFYAANALLLPYNTKYKGSSGPLMKGACTYGLPLVVSNIGEMGFLANKFELGFISEPSNSASLEDAMDRFLNSSFKERMEMRSRAIQLGESNTWADMARNYEIFFGKL